MQTRHSTVLLKSLAGALFIISFQGPLIGQEDTKKTREPVYRVGRSTDAETTIASSGAGEAAAEANPAAAAFARAMDLAYQGLDHIQTDIRDYTAVLVKRERIDGALSEPQFLEAKIRSRRPDENIPFSIYFKFLKPSNVKGREVIWVEGHNDNKLVAHDTGLIRGMIRANLDPLGSMAMSGNRYPIYEAGIENLVTKLIEKGERDQKLGEAEVKFYEKVKINGRDCLMIQVTHPEEKKPYEFHVCRVFIDKELRIPIRYSGFSWPAEKGGKPILEEEYTYINVKLNVGLTDKDFDPDNPEYSFP